MICRGPLLAACVMVAITLAACTRFNTQAFLANGFGHDLRPLLMGKEFVLGDGSLLVRGVTADDEIYQRFFGGGAETTESPERVFQGLDLTVTATREAPVFYRVFEADDDHKRVVTYQPGTLELAFLFIPEAL